MNSLVDLIERLQPEPYYFTGSYWPADRATLTHPMPFEFDCDFTHDERALNADGKYRAHVGTGQHPFKLSILFKPSSPHAVEAELEAPRIGNLNGRLVFVSSAGTFLGRSEQATLSAFLTVTDRGLISLIGSLELEGKYFGYALKGAVASSRATLSNVVGIRAPKRS